MLRLGFDVGGTNVAAGLVNEEKQVVHRLSERFPRGEGGEGLAGLMQSMAGRLCREAGLDVSGLTQVGVALPGTLDPERQTVLHAYNLNFHQTPLAHLLRQRFPGARICLLNDADAATWAEQIAGALRGCETGLLLTLGTGVGGGIINQGRLFHGGLGRGVEPGHMPLHLGGRRCSCGQRGCAERYCSARALACSGRQAALKAPDSLLAQVSHGRPELINAKTVVDCAMRDDPTAQAVFRGYLEELSSFLASLVNLLDPEIIALGGGLGQSGEFLCAPLRELVAAKCFFQSCGQIVPAELGNDAGIVGAALAA
ncbi:MAG: ROK family protein [Firmicutes bacterium]|nr:ROK family protein [Bacillota bacterium]